jgi:hypothetical protein
VRPRTVWRLGGERKNLRLTVDTTEPLVVELIERAARNSGIRLERIPVCASCGAEVFWSFPRPEDPCLDCGQPIAGLPPAEAPAPADRDEFGHGLGEIDGAGE